MAHKHNRRRQRPRSRNHDPASFGLYQTQSPILPTCYDPVTFSAVTPTTFAWTNMATSNTQGNPARVNANANANANASARTIVFNYRSAVSRPRRALKLASKTTPPILMDKSELEEEQIKLFGGEPGDDPSLCFKMLEAFGRMEWING